MSGRIEAPTVIAQAAALLSQLTPEDLVGDDSAEVVALREVGVRLFGRAVLQARYGEKDVVDFLREQAGHRTLLKRLETLQRQINKQHAKLLSDSRGAGINKARQATLDAIEAARAESTVQAEEERVLQLEQTPEGGSDGSSLVPFAHDAPAAAHPGPPSTRTRRHCSIPRAEGHSL